MTYTLKWGVMGPGRIASQFVNDLLHSKDELRKELLSGEIKHELVAVASSSSAARAKKFKDEAINEAGNDQIKCYGSYQELYDDPEVAIVYIATPNLNHFQLCYEALSNGKNVLMEKPFTINHKQAEILAEYAKKQKLFLMEAYWTKFNPVYRDIYNYVFGSDAPIGDVKRVESDLSFVFDEADPLMERIYSPKLGGGVTLDIGIYALYWALGFLDRDALPANFPKILAAANSADTGMDISTAVLLKFDKDNTLGVSSCSGYFENGAHQVVINGTKGRIEVDNSCYPAEYWGYNSKNELVLHRDYRFDGRGMFFEADHVAVCMKQGLLESDLHSMDHAIAMAKVLDTVREQVGTVYPPDLEDTTIPCK